MIKKCECCQKGDGCCQGKGPAVFEATRNGQKMSFCTKCVMGTDKDWEFIADMMHTDVYQKFDEEGFDLACMSRERGSMN